MRYFVTILSLLCGTRILSAVIASVHSISPGGLIRLRGIVLIRLHLPFYYYYI